MDHHNNHDNRPSEPERPKITWDHTEIDDEPCERFLVFAQKVVFCLLVLIVLMFVVEAYAHYHESYKPQQSIPPTIEENSSNEDNYEPNTNRERTVPKSESDRGRGCQCI